MTLTLRSGFVRGLKTFDDELRNFFAASASYRAASGSGNVILILDEDEELARLVRFIADRSNMDVTVVFISDPRDARKLIEESEESSVKAVIVDVDLLNRTNGSFYAWVRESKLNVPMFMKGTRAQITEFTGNGAGWRFGTFVQEETKPSDYVKALGFPRRCEVFAQEFAHAHSG